MATTQMQPTDARKAFPCFDEPHLKATFNVTLWRRPHMHALSNAERLSTRLECAPLAARSAAAAEFSCSCKRCWARRSYEGVQWAVDEFESTLRMPTYLLAFVVCDYVPQEQNDTKGRTFRVWTRAGQESSGRYALQLSIRVLNYFEELLGVPYPLKKLDHVPVPDFPAGAMENWGCITYKESALLYDDAQPNIRLQQQVAIIVTHELAHQVCPDASLPGLLCFVLFCSALLCFDPDSALLFFR